MIWKLFCIWCARRSKPSMPWACPCSAEAKILQTPDCVLRVAALPTLLPAESALSECARFACFRRMPTSRSIIKLKAARSTGEREWKSGGNRWQSKKKSRCDSKSHPLSIVRSPAANRRYPARMPQPRSSSPSKSPSESRRVTKKIYFVAGETSGDNHGAALMRALRQRSPNLQFVGRGGPEMRAIAAGEFRDWVDDAAVVGLWEVIKHYGFFREHFRRTISEIAAANPAAVVLIDYPGFNLRLARALRKNVPSLKILYYISPQVWAWNRRRIVKMGRWLDLMLCIFPFEPVLYDASGLKAVFVGHPMTGEMQAPADTCDPRLIALFPGSRRREVRKIFPIMHATACELLQADPSLHFEVAAASELLAEIIRKGLRDDAGKFSVIVGGARALMQRASVGLVASGTATLEAALSKLPFVLVYRVAWLTYLAARLVVRVKYLGMPNVLADREIVPEFIQHQARPRQIASTVARLLSDQSERVRMLNNFDLVAKKLGSGEASANAADAIVAELHQ